MLQRNSSKRLSLGHRKSTSSVRHKHEPVDPEVSRQQAQTAATLAFARANARRSTDNGLTRHNSTATYHESPEVPRRNSTASESERHVIRRQHSVRFAGPNAVPRRHAIAARVSQHSIVPRTSNGNLRPRAVTTDAPVPAQYRPPSRSSSIGKASIGKGTNASFVTALAYDEYYTKEDDVASTPSSYRRIRKSKSMFSPLQAPPVFYTNGTPDSRFTGEDSHIDQSPREILRAPKSMSFLRGGRDHILPGTRQRNDAAVQMARDKFLHNVEQQRLKAQPSFLFRSRKAREEKPFKKSLRNNYNGNGYGAAIASSNSIPAPKESGFKVKARRASQKIKNKIKKVFGKESKDEMMIPNQQVEALDTHVRKYNGDVDRRYDSSVEIPRSDDPTVSQVTSRLPSIHAAISNQQLRSSSASMRSIRSDAPLDDRSRVTSWATTTNNNTITSLARAQNEADRREQQRLSIINEYGTHHTSTTFSRRAVTNQSSAYPVIMTKSGRNPSPSGASVPTAVDSARVYSALMKRLEENSPKAKLEAQRKNSVDSFISPKKVPPRSSSVDRNRRSHSHHRVPATIRKVPSGFQLGEDGQRSTSSGSVRHHPPRSSSRGRHNQYPVQQSVQDCEWSIPVTVDSSRVREHDDVFSPDRKANIENNASSRNGPYLHHADMHASSSHKHNSKSDHTENQKSSQISINKHLTPQDIAICNEPIIIEKARKPLRDSRSTYFGSDAVTLRKTTSPYRRALAEKDYNPAVVTGDTPVRTTPLRDRPLLSQLGKENINPEPRLGDNFDRGTYTESIYSRTTSGQTPTASSSTLVLPMSQHSGMVYSKLGTGDAVVLERATYKPTNPASAHRTTPSNSSADWQGWMSSQIAVFEQEKNINSNSVVAYTLPSMPAMVPHTRGHMREKAQITDDDSEDSEDQRFSTVRELQSPVLQNSEAALIGPKYEEVSQRNPIRMPSIAVEMPQRNISNFINRLHMENRPNREDETVSMIERPISPEDIPKQQALPLKSILKKSSNVSLVEHTTPRIPTPPPMPLHSPLKSTQTASVGTRTPSVKTYTPASGSSRGRERNVLHKRNTSQSTLRSFNGVIAENMKGNGSQVTLRSINTPAKLVKKNGPPAGSIRSLKRDNENIRVVETRELGATTTTCFDGYDAQQVGSKRMVDLFLSSRRRQITGSSEDSSGRGDGVFL